MDCLAQHAHALIQEGAVDRLRCPEPSCKQALLLQVTLSNNLYKVKVEQDVIVDSPLEGKAIG